MSDKEVVITAETIISVNLEDARAWFFSLKEHPERYEFATHDGFEFVQGDFGEVGARFETRERFFGLRITLRFELTELDATHFCFRLIKPSFPIWGAFVLEDEAAHITRLRLEIGALSPFGGFFLRFPLVRQAIRRQIEREVEHVRASMESVLG